MRPALVLSIALGGCGKDVHTGDSEATTTTTGDTGTTTDTREPCLRVGSMTMDMVYGWDAAAGRTRPVIDSVNDLPIRSVFRVNLGASDWDGDTSLPGQPDRWCFVQWTIDDWEDDGRSPTSILSLSGIEPGQGVTNCGRESAPAAQDAVTVCPNAFDGFDPVDAMSNLAWGFRFGGPIPPAVAGVPYYYYAAGYTDDNFWGSDVQSSLFSAIDTLTYGWPIDDDGYTVLDAYGSPVKFTAAEVHGPDGLPSGVYIHVIPWIFQI